MSIEKAKEILAKAKEDIKSVSQAEIMQAIKVLSELRPVL